MDELYILWKWCYEDKILFQLTLSLPSPSNDQYLSAKHVLLIHLFFIYFIIYL